MTRCLQVAKVENVVCYTNNNYTNIFEGASFILYNCARLATLFKEFDKRVESKLYPPLPALEQIDFSLLSEPVGFLVQLYAF